jgi:hypothetical protein
MKILIRRDAVEKLGHTLFITYSLPIHKLPHLPKA